MRRGVQFDTYQPQAPTDAGSVPKPKFHGDRRTAPGPHVDGCAECGDTVGPWWGEAGEMFCSDHAPDDLKSPGRSA